MHIFLNLVTNNFEKLSAWAADIIAPAGMHIICIAPRYT